jgi:ubiquinone/menaquinone biosynthesis C-methylase UbiE
MRKLFHEPEKILNPYLQDGMTAIDIGCGMGFFSIGMAKLVGENGLVISVDLQQKMLDVLRKRAKGAGVAHRIRLHRCERDSIGIRQKGDFVLAFWMVHEVLNVKAFLGQIYLFLKSTGKFLLVEPKLHVSLSRFEEIIDCCRQAGFRMVDSPRILFSRTALFERS